MTGFLKEGEKIPCVTCKPGKQIYMQSKCICASQYILCYKSQQTCDSGMLKKGYSIQLLNNLAPSIFFHKALVVKKHGIQCARNTGSLAAG